MTLQKKNRFLKLKLLNNIIVNFLKIHMNMIHEVTNFYNNNTNFCYNSIHKLFLLLIL